METKKRKFFFSSLALVVSSAMIFAGCGGTSSSSNQAAPSNSKDSGTQKDAAQKPDKSKEAVTFKFAYDQPKDTGYGIAGDIFDKKLQELSGGTIKIKQFPSAQLGEEPEMLQKIRSGDIDFGISSTANASTIAPQSGVFSMHYLLQSEDHLKKVLADQQVNDLFKGMVKDSVQGAHVLNLMTLGFRDFYTKKDPIKNVDDLKGKKVRVQATKTEDMFFSAYGAQPVHMGFTEVYTSLQTGVMDVAENGINVYLSNKHYEVAPVLSLSQHEANNSVIWVSDKTWNKLTDEQKGWVQEAANEVAKTQPAKALELEAKSLDKLKGLGVQVYDKVDKTGFINQAKPIQDEVAKNLGDYAVKILKRVRELAQ